MWRYETAVNQNSSPCAAVPAGDQAPPPPRGPPLSGQHLPGGQHPDVVPVDGPERVHRLRLELRRLPRQLLRPDQPAGTAR